MKSTKQNYRNEIHYATYEIHTYVNKLYYRNLQETMWSLEQGALPVKLPHVRNSYLLQAYNHNNCITLST